MIEVGDKVTVCMECRSSLSFMTDRYFVATVQGRPADTGDTWKLIVDISGRNFSVEINPNSSSFVGIVAIKPESSDV